jgi:glycine cleavage system H lipoate-binding protein
MKTSANKTAGSGEKRITCFNVLENQCIWMKAGVINYRICDNAFDCHTCGFNKAMRKAMKIAPEADIATEAPKWVEHLIRRFDGANRPCRHALTGRIDAPKICPHNYECYHCEFDQMLDEMDMIDDLHTPAYMSVSGFNLAVDYYYHMGHGWTRFEHGGRVRIGFDDFVTRVFGRMTEIELPPLGAKVVQDQVGLTFGRGELGAAVMSPVTGVVLAVNHTAKAHPEVIEEDPYQHGWLFIVKPEMPKRNLKRLYFGKESYRWMELESRKLMGMMGPEYESLAATGGSLEKDIFGTCGQLRWERLVSEFLHTARKP